MTVSSTRNQNTGRSSLLAVSQNNNVDEFLIFAGKWTVTIDCDSKYMLMVSRFRDCCDDSLGMGLLLVCTLMEGRGEQGDTRTVGVPKTFFLEGKFVSSIFVKTNRDAACPSTVLLQVMLRFGQPLEKGIISLIVYLSRWKASRYPEAIR